MTTTRAWYTLRRGLLAIETCLENVLHGLANRYSRLGNRNSGMTVAADHAGCQLAADSRLSVPAEAGDDTKRHRLPSVLQKWPWQWPTEYKFQPAWAERPRGMQTRSQAKCHSGLKMIVRLFLCRIMQRRSKWTLWNRV
ncbi:unnamed protein product [Protopolystoma xenopodis]|uniref:Uncharacterized protein n=1 Tax=Protopolystoma xenopodis TaxID=117903 RepID=A0A448XK37_9PLAT|nr:unnamed protein product [Protopolystoma xenopodis]